MLGSMATVHLIDASPYIFRAYFSMPSTMTSPAGEPVGAVYGFGSFLARYLSEEQPTHLAVAFDRSLTTSFRNEIYPQYKAQRELPPPELEAQIDDCEALAAAFGGAVFIDERYEADDLIATLVDRLVTQGHGAVIVTSDKDLAQLVGPGVALYDFAREERYREEEVMEKFGVRPEQIADYLGLAGDSVDNIPGVAGVGAKTAAALLGHFRDLDDLYDRLDEVAEVKVRGARTLGAKLEAARETAFLSRRLATVARDAPAHSSLDDLRWDGAREPLVDELFQRLGFGGLKDRIPRWAA